jgi:hypothetical protein
MVVVPLKKKLVTSKEFFFYYHCVNVLFLDSNPTLAGDIDGHSIDLDETIY